MIQLYQKITYFKVLELFLKKPYEKYYLREASRILKMSPMTVSRALKLLTKEKLLKKEKNKNQILYQGNLEYLPFKHLKIAYNLSWLGKRNVIPFLKEKLSGLSTVVLYGSYAKGENDEKSDLDLLAISAMKSDVSSVLSKKLGREVNILNFTPAEWNNEAKKNRALYLDIVTEGIVLFGTRPITE